MKRRGVSLFSSHLLFCSAQRGIQHAAQNERRAEQKCARYCADHTYNLLKGQLLMQK